MMANMQFLTALVADKLPLIIPTITAFFAVILLQYVLRRDPLSAIPVIAQELGSDEKRRQAYMSRGKQLYSDGYRKFKDGIFRIVTTRKSTVVVISTKYLDELRKLPDNVLSFDEAIKESMVAKYTRLLIGDVTIPHTVKTGLTPALVRLNPSIADEVQESFKLEMPDCDDWTRVNINKKLLRIVARVSGRVFVGPELCHEEEYLDASINYTLELMEVQRAVSLMPLWKRPFLANRLPQVKKLDARIKKAHEFLRPVLATRMRLGKDDEKPDDMLQWIMDTQTKSGVTATEELLAKLQLGITFAAIHTTTMSTTNAFYTLAAYPSLAPELRAEIRSVLAENNNSFTSTALQSMKKLDSFLKETMRVYPASAATFQRKVLRPFTLSNGQVIPAGVIIEVPGYAASRDDDIFPDAEKFDAWRFYNLRQTARENGEIEGSAQNQFVSVSQSSLVFGYGRHACPGRFFAANEIKMIIANALLMYDITLADGKTERYPSLEFGSMIIPDPSRELLFKRIA
ncbi:cytochrome P450 [Bombardia bombarda]|uniref:Cytochrome P450 n=1 Tax=Bombardia bombarda TaxID=252184 RepID=A0AA39WAQ8_9PEZI|nr:cytochrome P450 [Bombardia bombarda]